MRYIKFWGSNGYAGCDWEEYSAIEEDGVTNDELDDRASDLGNGYAEMYEHVAEGYDMDDGWESEEAEEEYYQNIDYGWNEISKEEYMDGIAN